MFRFIGGSSLFSLNSPNFHPPAAMSDFQDKPVKAIKQRRQGVRMSALELLHEFFTRHLWYSDKANAAGGSCRVRDNGLVMHAPFNPFSEAHPSPKPEDSFTTMCL